MNTIQFSESDLDDLQFSEEYAEYIMANGDGTYVIYSGDSLLTAQEDGYLFSEFCAYMAEKISAQ